ncbi:BnaC09g32840D [Brassica napus]|uniref:BnaC09g32840D protein n=1 Tax=Brassica napus TaxID=3708 RepID=A0A078GL79_BRANA|nr:BnaC09g32840D [Brassica napus]
MATKPNGKSPITSDSDDNVIFFRDVSPGPHETQLRFRLIHFWEAWNPLKKTLIGIEMLLIDEQLRFRLIHFWEAWNPLKKTLIGIEMLLIDEQETVIQCFISPGRIERYLPKMKLGSVYKLNNFYGSRNKSVYRVSDHAVTVSFSWNSELSVLEDSPTHFDEDRFRFHSFEDFQASCDRKGDLYDIVGHKKLVNGQSFIGTPVLDEVEIARARHVLVHVQSHDGPVMKLYLWDQAAKEFCKKFKSYENTPTVLLVATVNTKSLGGTLALTSMSSSLFFYGLRCPTYDRLLRLSAEEVNAEVVTKRETLTIGEIFSYIKQGSTKEAFFEWTATIDDVVHGSTWYRAQISVYDNSEQAVFVLLGDAGFELTGKHASELVSNYFEANGNQGVTQEVPVPEALLSTISQKHKFCVKVTKHNLDGKSRSLTVTKILHLDTPPVTEASEGNNNSAEGSKRTNDIDEMGKAKRLKRGK